MWSRTAQVTDGWRSTAVAVWAALVVIAVVLVWRRLAGAFTVELTPLPACTFSTLAAIAGVGVWLLHRGSGPAAARAGHVVPIAATLGPPILVGLALWPAGSSGTMAYLTVLALLTAASLWALARFALPERGDSSPLCGTECAVSPEVESADESARARSGSTDDPPHSSVSQWNRRTVLPDGTEQIEGCVRVPFAAGQKHAVVHLAFTPPLRGVPAIECEPLDAADVEFKVSAAYPYGARLEVRRTEAANGPLEVEVGYTAEIPPQGGSP